MFYVPEKYKNIYTTVFQAKQINDIILLYVDKNSIITDSTSCIGGNSVFFAKTFKFVNVVEKNNDVLDTLCENLKNYNNTIIYKCSYNIIKFALRQDVIFIDPPWGGNNYKNKKKIKLFLDNIEIIRIINELYQFCKIICIKIPLNFDETSIETNFWYNKIYNIYKNKTKIYKIIIFHKSI